MKALSLSLAAISGAGLLFRSQLQSLVNFPHQGAADLLQHHQAPEGVYYLRAAYHFDSGHGVVRWAPGQELRAVPHMVDGDGSLTLTDGVDVRQVPQTSLTRDMDDAAALRQMEDSGQLAARQQSDQDSARQLAAARQQVDAARQQADAARQVDPNRIVSGQFHGTSLDAPAVRTNRAENIVSTASAPVLYPVYRTVVTNQYNRTVENRVIIERRPALPANTPRPVVPKSN